MEYLTYLFWTMLSVFVSYVAFIWIRYGVQRSISDSYYRLTEDPKMPPLLAQSLFTLFCWGFAFPAMIIGLTLTDNFLIFLATAGIMFVGVAAAFKGDKMTKEVHMIGAYGGVLFSQLSIAFDFHMYYVNVIFIVGAVLLQILNIVKIKKVSLVKNPVWWQEILAFGAIIYVFGIALHKLGLL